jgi:DNA-directed RNA polymerase beta subunit
LRVPLPYSAKLLVQELTSMNLKIKYVVDKV